MEKEKDKTIIVTTRQMQQIEAKLFAHQMPVASLMEKAALLSSQKIQHLYPINQYPTVGIIVGCGHNGGDGLVIARELFLHGYNIRLYVPLADKSKPLTAQHLNYAKFLGINLVENMEALTDCHLIIDSLFGFGLGRSISDRLANDIHTLNQWHKPIVSVDLPSGIDTDTGKVLGVAIKATDTLCLGLWKLGLFQTPAVEYIGNLHLVDIGIPNHVINEKIALDLAIELMTVTKVKTILPIPRPLNTHKYRQGNILLICGSNQYAGAALLSGYGANSGGVGMLTMIVPRSIKPLINNNLPSALVIATEETQKGAIEFIRVDDLDLSKYDVIAFGMGISRDITPATEQFFNQLLATENTLLIDADGLNLLAQGNFLQILSQRKGTTILTPHEGEFKRLFPDIDLNQNKLESLKEGAKRSNSIILLKGTKTIISDQGKYTWIIGEGTPALARGGSGDVLSGFISALIAQGDFSLYSVADMVAVGAWLHQQGGILAVKDVTQMGVDGVTLSQYITKYLSKIN